MTEVMSLHDILVFKYLPSSALKAMKSYFFSREFKGGEVFIEFGQPMPGLYLVVSGHMDVYTENFDELITKLEVGSSIGEMSLIEGNSLASASLKAGVDGTRIIGCSKEDFNKKVLSDEYLAYRFYKGVSELLSSRLRNTNRIMKDRIDTVKESIKQIFDQNLIISRVAHVMGNVDDIGCELVEVLGNIVMELEQFIEANTAIDTAVVSKAKDLIEKTILEDMQTIDRTSQKLGLIVQFLENIKSTLVNEQLSEIQGDTKLFDS
ncbi:MAG: cyclic nucleotide-binding domain-containing protein [Bdellovibrionota bacterium]